MTAVYDRSGIRFLYPENWTISDERLGQSPRSVSVQSPGSAFWSLHLYESEAPPWEAVAEVLRAMRQEYEGLESRRVTESLGQVEAVGYDMDFYCLDFVVTAQTRSFQYGGRTFLTLCQAEDREFEGLREVFRAITISLLPFPPAGRSMDASTPSPGADAQNK